MTLFEILPTFLHGKKIHRLSWPNTIWIETSDGDTIKLFVDEGDGKRLLHLGEKFSLDDITSDDWELYK